MAGMAQKRAIKALLSLWSLLYERFLFYTPFAVVLPSGQFFYNSTNTYAIVMKLCPSEPNLVTNILKSKWPIT